MGGAICSAENLIGFLRIWAVRRVGCERSEPGNG
jgi:hypothetical protein